MAVLGDMYELGDYEDKGHREVGAKAAQLEWIYWLPLEKRRD